MTQAKLYSEQCRTYGQWINGKEIKAENLIERFAPESGKVVAQFAEGTKEDALLAIENAKETFEAGTWSRMPGAERAKILARWARLVEEESELLTRIEIEESGKIRRVAEGDIAGTVDLIVYASSLANQVSGQAYMDIGEGLNAFVVKEPAGVVGAIVPWNFPTIIFGQKVPLALAAGCSVVVKPSEFTSGTAVELARLAKKAGVPDGVLNVVTGYGVPVGQTISESADVDVVSFTGSTRTGQLIAQGQGTNFKKISLELGGKSAAIVFEDADFDAAIDGVLFSIFLHQGQVCCAGSRLLVHENIAEKFVHALKARAEALVTGPLDDAKTEVGPLVSPEHLKIVQGYVSSAIDDGAEVICGGKVTQQAAYPDAPAQTFLPTILNGITPAMPIFYNEVFGPVLTVTKFSTREEAVKLANDSNYGLAGSVWTENIQTAFYVAQRVRTGTIEINTCLEGKPQLPFGGYKASGLGREKGLTGLEEFTETKTIGLRVSPKKGFFGG
ncbi:betaine aldehyde dehydrogenase [Neokomagataea thailandica NBRC 106555]|uniref:Betaine aldehyde dehydrogenase n=1 Tax=Neokomagataea thailandica NBRC 106555 TaxID=1223520 RepID=A0ABQ0QPI0_9PROT|nr:MULTISPECIES: aldehyde dehydrogenase family protein [Neokomagataea]GBR52415.1 betaine aldehyde dehydrogenase [Neokomagataea thailandica NBRC 106555]